MGVSTTRYILAIRQIRNLHLSGEKVLFSDNYQVKLCRGQNLVPKRYIIAYRPILKIQHQKVK